MQLLSITDYLDLLAYPDSTKLISDRESLDLIAASSIELIEGFTNYAQLTIHEIPKLDTEDKEQMISFLKIAINNSLDLLKFCTINYNEEPERYTELFSVVSSGYDSFAKILATLSPSYEIPARPSKITQQVASERPPMELFDFDLSSLFVIGLNSSKYTKESVVKEILSRMDHHAPSVEVAQGPFNKSKYTYQLEELVEQILNGSELRLKTNSSEDNILFIPATDKEYNVTKILKNANISHLQIKKELEEKYINFLANTAGFKPYLIDIPEFPSERDFRDIDPENEHQELSYAEKLAINVYTGNAYEDMNNLLRGKPTTNNTEYFIENILHVAFCAQGLKHIPVKQFDYAIRGESRLSEEAISTRMKAVENGEILQEVGFVSTSIANIVPGFDKGKAKILFTGGLLGQNVVKLSANPQESEVLMIPSQMRWEGYKQSGNEIYFHVKLIRTITALTAQQQQPPKAKSNKTSTPESNETSTTNPHLTRSKGLSPMLVLTERKPEKNTVEKSDKLPVKSKKKFTR